VEVVAEEAAAAVVAAVVATAAAVAEAAAAVVVAAAAVAEAVAAATGNVGAGLQTRPNFGPIFSALHPIAACTRFFCLNRATGCPAARGAPALCSAGISGLHWTTKKIKSKPQSTAEAKFCNAFLPYLATAGKFPASNSGNQHPKNPTSET
jgi:hypothetical protein